MPVMPDLSVSGSIRSAAIPQIHMEAGIAFRLKRFNTSDVDFHFFYNNIEVRLNFSGA